MAIAACSAMSIMAYLAPDLVVPLVQDRFQVRSMVLSALEPHLFKSVCGLGADA